MSDQPSRHLNCGKYPLWHGRITATASGDTAIINSGQGKE
uniref:Uncharacterized protein n=1 Tax=Siphoviridae sp. ctKFk2 TaxID=2827841 RepID=A0A8S5T0H5_9CAUD|nr:MAG TPA: hypothetical protein [Siphoviridae sp. ctKFk2]DAM67896.1 MAG TPA: hypothetical protein [Caudoviricetes sp.]